MSPLPLLPPLIRRPARDAHPAVARRLPRALAGLLVAGALLGCGPDAAPPPAPPVAASSAAVRWVPARPPGTTALLEAPAHVIAGPAGRAVISAPLRARIHAVLVQPGEAVAAGAPVVEVVLPEAAAAASAYLAAVDELAAHERRVAQLEALRQEGLGRAADVAAIQLELARLRGARDGAATTLRAAGLAVTDARALAASGGRTVLRAPLAGVVVGVEAVRGASPAPEAPLAEIAAAGATRVEARLPRPLPPEASAEFVSIGGAPIAARLVSTAPAQEPDGSTRAWFELAAPAPAGASGRLRGTLPASAAVVVPATALAREPGGVYVWRRDGDQPRRAPVRVLATSGADALVEGLAPGVEVAAIAAAVEAT